MIHLDLTHLASLALGALLGAAALWAYRRTRSARRASQGLESALRAELKLATEIAGVGMWRMDPVTRKVTCDATLQQMLGVGEMVDDGLLPVHPDDRQRTSEAFDEAVRSPDGSCSLRARVLHPNGTVRHIETHFRRLAVDGRADSRSELIGVTRDITEEVEHAEQQRALAERLNIATESAGISCWELDIQARRYAWIENANREFHSATPELSLDVLLEKVQPDDRALIEARLIAVRDNGEERISYRYRVQGRSGQLLNIQTHARVLRTANGGLHLLGVSWDITKEIEAAERLQQQARILGEVERRLERASLSSSEGHWEKDLMHGNLWFSSSYHALLGFEDGELSGEPSVAAERVHPGDLERARQDLQQHIERGTPFDSLLRLKMKSGEYRWFRHRGMVERDEQGRARSMAGSIHDAHEQKLAEDALKQTRQRLERAINGTQDGLWEMDADGSSWHSPRVAELLGYIDDELPPGCNFLKEFLHPDDESAVATATRVHFQERSPYDVEVRLRTRIGDYRWYRARATAERDSHGRPLRLSGSLQDVTDARSAREALLQATEAAESANRAKSEFLANVSHEIRTPMNGIIGMTGLLIESPLDRTQRDYAETIRSSADSLLIVINDILDFSKIEAGKLDIEALELDLRDIVEDVAVMLAFQAAAKNLELVVHIHPDVPNRVVGDPQRIRQCLINLVSNAIKFTREGEIVIEVSSYDFGDGQLRSRFEVRDTGIGIAAGTLQNLFQPFVQADSSTTRHFGGTGLGLSIVRRLVQMMGGDVGALSELNKGSCFWFTLPLPPATLAAVMSPAPLDLNRVGRRVLVVDDNETNRRVLAGQLMHAGFEVSLAGGGIEAMSLLHRASVDGQPFEVVLADHRMHDMDGATLGERINADLQLSQARLVMLTSVDGHGDIHRFASLGFAAYLTKPIRARELLECLDRVLAHDSKTWHMQSQPIVTRNTLAAHVAETYRGTVLLVEDNAVNQKVAVRFLERMGCTVRVADNGVEAVRACEETTFDLILMDLQMPVMDGLTATQRIRERETGDGRPNAPIVALTANAMASQLERCMEAGMSAFLTKPLEIQRLHEVLTKFGLRVTPEDTVVSHENSPANVPVNLSRLNELTDGDPEFTRELVETFIASGEQVLDEARAALAALDRTGLSRIAHKLKGASANIHAEPLRNLSHALESQASSLDQQRLHELVTQLARELERARDFLNQYAPPLTAKAS